MSYALHTGHALDVLATLAAIRKGGPLYKVSSHIWAALAVGLTYLDQQKTGGTL